jgi:hypothetical protein
VGGTARCDVLTSSFWGLLFRFYLFVGLLEWLQIGNPRSFFRCVCLAAWRVAAQ